MLSPIRYTLVSVHRYQFTVVRKNLRSFFSVSLSADRQAVNGDRIFRQPSPLKKCEKLRIVNGEGIFRYSATDVRDLSACPHRQKSTKTSFSVNGERTTVNSYIRYTLLHAIRYLTRHIRAPTEESFSSSRS